MVEPMRLRLSPERAVNAGASNLVFAPYARWRIGVRRAITDSW
jgi:hypothetical protein